MCVCVCTCSCHVFAGSDWLKSDKRNLHGQQEPKQVERCVGNEYPERTWEVSIRADQFQDRPAHSIMDSQFQR